MDNLEVVDAGSAPTQDVEMFQGELSQEIPSGDIPTADIDPVSGQEVAAQLVKPQKIVLTQKKTLIGMSTGSHRLIKPRVSYLDLEKN